MRTVIVAVWIAGPFAFWSHHWSSWIHRHDGTHQSWGVIPLLVARSEVNTSLDNLIEMPIREQIGRAKYIPEKEHKVKFAELFKDLDAAFTALTEEGDLDA